MRCPAAVVGALLLLTSAAPFAAPAAEWRFGVARVATQFDPRFATDAESVRLGRLLFIPPIDFDCQSRPVPAATEWDWDSPTQITMRLRAGLEFRNGTEMTAADLAATYTSVLDENVGSPLRSGLRAIAAIHVLDRYTLQLTLSHHDPWLPGNLTIGILPSAVAEGVRPLTLATDTAGQFSVSLQDGEQLLRLTRDDGLKVTFVKVPEPAVRVLKLVKGEIDLLQNDLMPELEQYLAAQRGIETAFVAGTNFAYLGFNLEDPVTGQIEVRQAIAHAINRRALIEHLMRGKERLAATVFPPEHWVAASDVPVYPHDPAKARALLAGLGYDENNPLVIEYKTSTDPFRIRVATFFQQQLAEANIRVELKTYDWGTFFGDIKAGRFQMYSLIWVGIRSPDFFDYVFHSASVPPAGANRGRWRDPLADALLDRAVRGQVKMEERLRAFRAVQRRAAEALPYVPLWYEDQFVASRPGVVGYRPSAEGHYDALVNAGRARKVASWQGCLSEHDSRNTHTH